MINLYLSPGDLSSYDMAHISLPCEGHVEVAGAHRPLAPDTTALLFTCVFGSERPRSTELIEFMPGAQPLERGAGCEHIHIRVASPDDLHPNGELALGQSRRDRGCWVTGEVDEVRQAPADQGIDLFSIDLGGAHGIPITGVLDRQTRKGWRDQEIIPAQGVLNGVVNLRPDFLIMPEVENRHLAALV